MGKPRIELPDTFLFTAELQVRVTDLNYGAHLGNDRMLGLVHEARYLYLKSLGSAELDIGGLRLVVSDAVLTYHAEVFAGDRLGFDIALGESSARRAEMLYRVRRLSDDKVVARAATGLAFIDPSEGTVVAPPLERLTPG